MTFLGATPAGATTGCAQLNQVKVPASVISLPTTGGRVHAAALTSSVVSGQTIAYCQVDADLYPVDRSAPAIKMRLALPHGWTTRR